MLARIISTVTLILITTGFVACGVAPLATPPPTPANIVAENPDTGLAVADATVNATTVNGAAYLTLINNGDAPDRLLGVAADVAEAVELHESVMDGNMMQMHPIEGLDIPAGEAVLLEPGGYHIMLIDLRQELSTGDNVNLTLTFEKSGEMVIPATVQQGAMGAHEADDHAGEDSDHGHDAAEPMALEPAALAEGEKLNVVATTNIVADLVRQVGGEAIDLHVLLPLGSDPHSFEPTPQDIATASSGQVIFVNGLGLEEFLQQMVETAGGQMTVVAVADGIDAAKNAAKMEDDDHAAEHHDEDADADDHAEEHHDEDADDHAEEHHDEDADDHHGHDHGGVDPHVWVTPANAVTMVENIERALAALDPANADTYHANAQQYQAELEELDRWVQTQIDSIPPENREMVTDHQTFNYYADRYGLEMIGAVVPAYSTNAEPSAQELARLQDTINDLGVKAVFVGVTVNSALAEQISADSGIELIPLYTGSLGEPGSGAETYVDYIRYNTNAIVEGLKD